MAEHLLAKLEKVRGRKLQRSLQDIARLLSTSPQMGRQVPGFRLDALREVLVDGYLVVYRLNAHNVEIAVVFHTQAPSP